MVSDPVVSVNGINLSSIDTLPLIIIVSEPIGSTSSLQLNRSDQLNPSPPPSHEIAQVSTGGFPIIESITPVQSLFIVPVVLLMVPEMLPELLMVPELTMVPEKLLMVPVLLMVPPALLLMVPWLLMWLELSMMPLESLLMVAPLPLLSDPLFDIVMVPALLMVLLPPLPMVPPILLMVPKLEMVLPELVISVPEPCDNVMVPVAKLVRVAPLELRRPKPPVGDIAMSPELLMVPPLKLLMVPELLIWPLVVISMVPVAVFVRV